MEYYGLLDVTPLDEFVLAPDVGVTSSVGINMLSWVPPIYDDAFVAQIIYEAIGLEWDSAEAMTTDLQAQFFPQTATWGLSYWEMALSVTTNTALTTAQRRAQIITKRSQQTVVNRASLRQVVYSLTGVAVVVNNEYDDYTFEVVMPQLPLSLYNQVLAVIDNMKPAHMDYHVTSSDNSWRELAAKTWGYIADKTWFEVLKNTL